MFGSLFRPRRSKSADTAKERLQILLAHDRIDRSNADLLPLLQKEILEVVKRHVQVGGDSVDIRLERGEGASMLEINIELPAPQPIGERIPA